MNFSSITKLHNNISTGHCGSIFGNPWLTYQTKRLSKIPKLECVSNVSLLPYILTYSIGHLNSHVCIYTQMYVHMHTHTHKHTCAQRHIDGTHTSRALSELHIDIDTVIVSCRDILCSKRIKYVQAERWISYVTFWYV